MQCDFQMVRFEDVPSVIVFYCAVVIFSKVLVVSTNVFCTSYAVCMILLITLALLLTPLKNLNHLIHSLEMR